MQSKIKFPEKIRGILYRSTFLQNISVLIINTVQLDDFRSDNTRFGRPHIITKVSGLAGLAVINFGISLAFARLAGLAVRNRNISLASARMVGLAVSLAFTLFNGYIQHHTALEEHHQTPKIK